MPMNRSQLPRGDTAPPMVVDRQRPRMLWDEAEQVDDQEEVSVSEQGTTTTPTQDKSDIMSDFKPTVSEQGTTTTPTQGINLEAGLPSELEEQDEMEEPEKEEESQEGETKGMPEKQMPTEAKGKITNSREYKGLLLAVKQMLYEQNFERTFKYLLSTDPKSMPKTVATIVNTILTRLENEGGQIPDDILMELGQDTIDMLASDLRDLGVQVDDEFLAQSLLFSILIWMRGNRDRLPPGLGDKAKAFLQQGKGGATSGETAQAQPIPAETEAQMSEQMPEQMPEQPAGQLPEEVLQSQAEPQQSAEQMQQEIQARMRQNMEQSAILQQKAQEIAKRLSEIKQQISALEQYSPIAPS